MKTYSVKPSEITRKWYIIDASDTTIGRLSTRIATLLSGKDKSIFTHHIDCGDYVIIINAEKLKVTGDKERAKKYYRYSGYPSGLTTTSLGDQLDADPTVVIEKAVRGMLPANKLRPERLKRLKIYAGEAHPHDPQQPVKLSLKEGTR